MTEINKDNKKMGFEALGANYRNSAFTPDDTAKGIMLFIEQVFRFFGRHI